MLCATLAWLFRAQSRFSPAVDIAFHGPNATAEPVRARAQDLVSPLPRDLRPMSAAEAFAPETLSDKIDGKAEVYLSAGVVGLRCQRMALAAAPSSWIELFVFDMGKPSNAYSVYSSQRRADVTDLQLADYAYRAGNEIALVHGPFYVEVVATDESPSDHRGRKRARKGLRRRDPGHGARRREIRPGAVSTRGPRSRQRDAAEH